MAADESGPKNADDAKGEGQRGDERRSQERRQRTPVTIDLAAEEVSARASASDTAAAEPARAEPPKPAAEPPKAEAAKPERAAGERPATNRLGAGAQALRGAAARALHGEGGWRQSVYAGIVGGILAFILVLVLQAVGLLPAPGRSLASQALEQAQGAADAATGLERRITAMEAMTEGLAAMRSDIRALSERIGSLEQARAGLAAKSEVAAVSTGLAEIRKTMQDSPPAATRADLDALGERISHLEVAIAAGTGSGASEAALASLSARIDSTQASTRALADRVSAAETRSAPLTAGEAAMQAVALSSLRRSAAGDQPFIADVDLIASLGASADTVTKLRPLATSGVASAATLAKEFPGVADAILAAAADSDPDAGFFRRLVHGLGSLVTIRPTGPISGSEPVAVVSRMAAAVEKGDLAAALDEREALPEAGRNASAAWAAAARDRVALDTLIDSLAQSVDG